MKNVELNLSSATLKKALVAFLYRFHVMVFVIIVLGGLIVATLVLNTIILRSEEAGDYTPSEANTSFDEATIRRIEQLRTSDQAPDLTFPGGRTNPFVE